LSEFIFMFLLGAMASLLFTFHSLYLAVFGP